MWTELCVFWGREREEKGNTTQRAGNCELQSGPRQQGQERMRSLWESFTSMVCSGTGSKAARCGVVDSSMQSALPTEENKFGKQDHLYFQSIYLLLWWSQISPTSNDDVPRRTAAVLTQRSSERLSVSTGFRWWSLHTGVSGWVRWCAGPPAMATHREQMHFLRQSWTWFWSCTLQQKKHGEWSPMASLLWVLLWLEKSLGNLPSHKQESSL